MAESGADLPRSQAWWRRINPSVAIAAAVVATGALFFLRPWESPPPPEVMRHTTLSTVADVDVCSGGTGQLEGSAIINLETWAESVGPTARIRHTYPSGEPYEEVIEGQLLDPDAVWTRGTSLDFGWTCDLEAEGEVIPDPDPPPEGLLVELLGLGVGAFLDPDGAPTRRDLIEAYVGFDTTVEALAPGPDSKGRPSVVIRDSIPTVGGNIIAEWYIDEVTYLVNEAVFTYDVPGRLEGTVITTIGLVEWIPYSAEKFQHEGYERSG